MMPDATTEAKKPQKKPAKTKFSIAVAEKIFDMIAKGNYAETAACFAGISRGTYRNWLKRGRDELRRIKENPRAKVNAVEADFVFFVQRIEECLAKSETMGIEIIRKAAQGGFVSLEVKETVNAQGQVIKKETIRKTSGPQWQAEAWRLERMFPDKYGRRIQIEKGEKGEGGTGTKSAEEFMQECQETAEKMMSFTPTDAPPRAQE